MNGIEKDESTVLVINGVPYSLVRDLEPNNNLVCNRCDLAEMCPYIGEQFYEHFLCWPKSLGPEWYFIIDWDIINKQISDYLDIDQK